MSRQAEPPYELNDPLQWHSKKRSKIRLSWSVIVSGGIILLITLVAISASFIYHSIRIRSASGND